MIFQKGTLRSGMSDKAVGRRCTGRREMYCNWMRRCILCPYCEVELTMVLMAVHRQRMHGMKPDIDWKRLLISQTEHTPQVFDVNFPKGMLQCRFSIPRCLGS